MPASSLEPELERRIAALELEQNQGASFGTADWLWLIILGIVGPALILVWGWSS